MGDSRGVIGCAASLQSVMRPALLSHFRALSQYLPASSGIRVSRLTQRPALRHGSAHSSARVLKNAILPW